MEKNNLIRRCVVVAILLAISALVGCELERPDIQTMKEDLLQTDRQFSMISANEGIRPAFMQFMADSAILYREGYAPFIGREAINDVLGAYPSGAELTWEPWKAEVAESGDLGYTLGQYTYSIPDELTDERKFFYGNYVSIWKKVGEEWKWVFDAGTSAPNPNDN